ncbi:MAG: hypothetical protein ABIK15_00385 [Pseudomonadota bacterium]
MDTDKYQYSTYNQIKKSVPGSESATVKKILKQGEEVQWQAMNDVYNKTSRKGCENYEKAKNSHYEKPGKATFISVLT